MDESSDNHEECAPKRSRSDEEMIDKDISSSGDSGQQSPYDKQQEEQSMSARGSSNNNSNNSNNHFNNNSDSRLKLKMEDSTCSDANRDLILKLDNDTVIVTLLDSEQELDDQQMSTNDSIMGNEKPAGGVEVNEIVTASGSRSDGDKPTTSTSTLIKRHKRNRSRNYRISGLSSSSSSESSNSDRAEAQREEQAQEEVESEESSSSSDLLSPINSIAEELTIPSAYMFLPNLQESSASRFSYASSSNNDDDDPDFNQSFVDERLRAGYISNDSEDSNRNDEEVNKVINKEKPPYIWCASYELMCREHGLNVDGRTSLRNGFSYGFKNRFYASRHIIERMQISDVLHKHLGCVNCLNFNKSGNLLVSGSDDARLIVWDWAESETKHVWKSGHSANIFQSKFLPSSTCIDIISAGRDGKVRRSVVPPSGGKVQTSHLYYHSGAVHKLVICPDNPSQIISVGEDGFICSKDLREDNCKVEMLKVFSIKKETRKARLFSISHHPLAPEICVSGNDPYVRVYDKRSMKDPVYIMSPAVLSGTITPNVTCCVYNNTGTEILATFSEDNIYLFSNKNYVYGEYLHSYRGHFNQKTIKGVNFFGPNCEYVISGSDCGNVFFWDKNSEAIVNFMAGDNTGVVNCLEPHPTTPILATSGLDYNIKILTPSAKTYPPDLSRLTNCVRRNIRRADNDRTDMDPQQLQYFIRQVMWHTRRNRRNPNSDDTESDNASSSSDDSAALDINSDNDYDYSDDDDDVNVHVGYSTCGTQ